MLTMTATAGSTDSEPSTARLVPSVHDLQALHQTYGTRAQALAYRITRDRELAADAVQEALLAVWRARDNYDPARGSLSGWFLTIVHRRSVDQVRRTTPRVRALRAEEAERIPAQETGPAENAVRSDQGRQLRAAIDRLPALQRQAVALAYYGGYTQTQIAALLDLPLGTVKTRTSSALSRLRATASLEPFRPGRSSALLGHG